MKEIVIKRGGKKVYQFIVSDTQLKIAEKLGISREQYIMERSKIELEERHKRNEQTKN